jgi:hypothetical protein
MLRSMKDLEGYSLGATDGVIGRVRDFYFDDEAWVIRYLIVETGDKRGDRRVLISPIGIGRPDWSQKILPVAITKEAVRLSPDIDTDKPVSRQQEMGYLGYYGYGNYWGGSGLWGAGFYPDILQGGLARQTGSQGHAHDDHHLRSGNDVMRYYVHASDGDIGHVQGFLVDESSWAIRYIIVNTSNWWLGHDVLVAPEWIVSVSWAESTVAVGLTREAVKTSPTYEAGKPMSDEEETAIHAHYGRTAYRPHEPHYAAAQPRPSPAELRP